MLSELPPGTQPLRWSFPARNRIMAGLARMTVVVEAADPSGSLITSDFARDLGRCVAAVPGQVTSTVARGTNGLLRDGAVPVTGTEDVLDELFGVGCAWAGRRSRLRSLPDDPRLRRVLEAAERTVLGVRDRGRHRPGVPRDPRRARAARSRRATSSGARSTAGSAPWGLSLPGP